MNYTVKNIQNHGKTILGSLYPLREIDSMLFLIFEKVASLSRLHVISNPDTKIPFSDYKQIMHIFERLKRYEPIQYILGETEFYSLTIEVNPSVLIPRPETEELVHWIIEEVRNKPVKALDVGTGSGCIAIALAKNIVNSEIHAIDISEQALGTALKNATKNKVSVSFQQADILASQLQFFDSVFDLVVSNPPYIRELEKRQMQRNVLDYEPVTALFVPDSDPLLFYRHIARHSQRLLKQGGTLFFEINEGLDNEMILLLEEFHYSDILLKNDFQGKPRMIKATRS